MTDKPPPPDNTDPDWSLLPRHPVKFFSLPDGWGENELKSAYSKLIRKFKPDRAPEEFQKIRRAYDFLKIQLESGSDLSSLYQVTHFEDVENNSSSSSWPNERWGLLPDPDPVVVGIDPSHPDESFRRLLAKPVKSADEYIDLAILADIVSEQSFPDRQSFEAWLWDGLMVYPKSRPLMEILAAHYNDPTNKDIDFEAAITRVEEFRPHSVSDELLAGLIFGVIKTKGIDTGLKVWDQRFQPFASGYGEIMIVLIDLIPTAAWFEQDNWVEKQKKHLESDNNWQKLDFETLERVLQVVGLARKVPASSQQETALARKIREICQKVLTLSPQSRRELLLKSVDEICKRRDSFLEIKVTPGNASYWLAELWEYLLMKSEVIRPVGGVSAGQVLNLRRVMADVCKDIPIWIWNGAQWSTSILFTLLIILSFCSVMLFIFIDMDFEKSDGTISVLLFLAFIVSMIVLYTNQNSIRAKLRKILWSLLERSYRVQRGRLLEFFNAQPMPVRAFPILLDNNKANEFPGVNKAVCRAILSDSDLLLLSVTSRAML